MTLLDDESLWRSSVVANCAMNRERGLASYRRELGVDLVTCVHGLHYVGDKLGLLVRAASWLVPGGRFVANFDVAGVRRADGSPFAAC
ncbi:class I SAM-dependent methyltransferase [Lentzea terrae]|uniref:hypothetical protein n=1 Tax=Lentzea terrae TaxID=2200761 RepID=UPI001E5CDF1E|nr:hypothetical protein [Lentzea terrae]